MCPSPMVISSSARKRLRMRRLQEQVRRYSRRAVRTGRDPVGYLWFQPFRFLCQMFELDYPKGLRYHQYVEHAPPSSCPRERDYRDGWRVVYDSTRDTLVLVQVPLVLLAAPAA